VALAVLVVASGYAHAQPEALNAVLSLDEETYVLGQPIFFTLVLKNTGKEPVRAHLAEALDGFDLEIASGPEAFRPLALRAVEVLGQRAPLRTFQPGDIIVFYYMRGGKPNWYHSAVIVSLDGSGKLSNDDVILMVNSSHRQSGETGDARKHYRTRLMKLEGLLREDTGPGWNYEYATVLRASK